MNPNPVIADEHVTLWYGDCLEVMATLNDNCVDAVVTDPPYGLEFMGKSWDAIGNIGKAKNRGMGGIAQKGMTLPESYNADVNVKCEGCSRWKKDHADRKCACEAPQFPNVKAHQAQAMQEWHLAWATECLRVLKPGGYMLAFGGSRTWHRLACAVEDAGFEIRDSIAWLYGSGFPKSLDVSKAIDKRKIGSAEVDAFKRALGAAVSASGKTRTQINAECGFTMRFDITFDRDPEGWGCSLPTPEQYDVICRVLAMDGAGGVEQLRAWPRTSMEKLYRVTGYEERLNSPSGVVGLGRGSTPVVRELTEPGTEAAKQWQGWGTALKPAFEPIVVGRKPLQGTVAANVLAHGTGALNINACRIEAGQDYRDKCASVVGLDSNRNGSAYGEWTGIREDSASPAGRWPTNVVIDEHTAASIDEQSGTRSSGHFPKGQNTQPGAPSGSMGSGWSNSVAPERSLDGGGASRFFPTFRYEAKAPTEERPMANGVAHPTVKPLDLMRWLVRLVTPPGGVVLEPFAGSGTTAEACVHEHRTCIAIEREPDYIELIKARLSKPMEIGFNFGEIA